MFQIPDERVLLRFLRARNFDIEKVRFVEVLIFCMNEITREYNVHNTKISVHSKSTISAGVCCELLVVDALSASFLAALLKRVESIITLPSRASHLAPLIRRMIATIPTRSLTMHCKKPYVTLPLLSSRLTLLIRVQVDALLH